MTSPESRERVLVVDEDLGVLDFITRQVVEPLGYSTASARDADGAIQQALDFKPHLIIVSLTLQGLSGKDLIVALRSRGIEVPILVTADEGMEADAIQAFRLGARNYLVKPLRETEVVAAVEHALKENRLRQERQDLADQIARSNRQLEQRVRELTTLYSIGQAVTSMTSQPDLLTKLIDESVSVANADMGWIVLRDDVHQALMLKAQHGFPNPIASKLHQAWDDGLSSLVMRSGEPLAIHGEDLERFELGRYAKTAMISPMKLHSELAGVIGVAREAVRPFDEREEAMLAAVADYASISLVNVRLFQALAARARKLEKVLDERRLGSRVQTSWQEEVRARLIAIRLQLAELARASKSSRTKAGLKVISDQLKELMKDVVEVSRREVPVPETPASEGR